MKRYFKAMLLTLVFLLGIVCHGLPLQAAEDVRQEVVDIIQEYYPYPVEPGILQRTSAKAVVEGLNDPFSDYLTMDQYNGFMQSLDGSFAGIGIFVEMQPQGVLITDTLPDSPAQLAGLRRGDMIISINNQSLAGLTMQEAMDRLQGKEGSQVLLTVMREARQFDMRLKRAFLALPSVRGLQMEHRVGYVAVYSFGSNTAIELEQYIRAMDPDTDQWILDLRGNGGGYLFTAAEVAGYLMSVNNMVALKQKNDWLELPVVAQSTMIDEPVVLLVDGYSASASELLAAALKDYRRALLIGENTYGKGTMQQSFTLSNGDILHLTIAEFYSPLGNKVHQAGVKPDLEIKSDQALDAAWLLLSRPVGGSSHAYITVGGEKCLIDLQVARSDQYWEAWDSVTQNLDELSVECGINSAMHTVNLSRADVVSRWPVYYPDYRLAGEYYNLDKNQPVSVGIQGLDPSWPEFKSAFELIDSQSGERVSFDISSEGTALSLQPLESVNGHEYWLLWHGSPSAHGPAADSARPAIAILHYDN